MIQKFFPYVFIFIILWYLPEISLFFRGVSTDLFNETSVKTTYRVEAKVVKPVSFLPEKFALLSKGVENIWLELYGISTGMVKGNLTDEYGNVVIESVPPGIYNVRIGTMPDYTPQEIAQAESSGASIFEESATLPSSLDQVEIKKDVYLVPIIRETK